MGEGAADCFGFCPRCREEGLVLAHRATTGPPVVMCDECDEIWAHPRDIPTGPSFSTYGELIEALPRGRTRHKLGPLATQDEIPWTWLPYQVEARALHLVRPTTGRR